MTTMKEYLQTHSKMTEAPTMLSVTRRQFLCVCTGAAASLGLAAQDLAGLREVLANPRGPSVLWLQGSGCSGCTISFLNYLSPTPPKAVADLLVDSVNLIYHPMLAAAAGAAAVRSVRTAVDQGNFILVIEGAVPTSFDGRTCPAWAEGGAEKTFQQVVIELAAKTDRILCLGNCAAWGGLLTSGPNVTGVQGARAVTGKTTVNIAGCPPHPDWMVGALIQLLQGKNIPLDAHGRPRNIFGKTVCDRCPLEDRGEARRFGEANRCLEGLGCRGENTRAPCPTLKWNNGVNWCMGAGAPCIGCTNPDFPGRRRLVRSN
jgi:hydrogenase small subunit